MEPMQSISRNTLISVTTLIFLTIYVTVYHAFNGIRMLTNADRALHSHAPYGLSKYYNSNEQYGHIMIDSVVEFEADDKTKVKSTVVGIEYENLALPFVKEEITLATGQILEVQPNDQSADGGRWILKKLQNVGHDKKGRLYLQKGQKGMKLVDRKGLAS